MKQETLEAQSVISMNNNYIRETPWTANKIENESR